jgi:hypothetical protein
LLLDHWFLASLKAGGMLRVRQWTLTAYDATLRELGHDVWRFARVLRVRFPALGASGDDMPHILVHMLVGDVGDGNPPATSSSPASVGASANHGDSLQVSIMSWKIDGVGEFYASGMSAFYLGEQASDELVFSFGPDASANIFRDWLRGGNTPRSGSLHLFNAALEARFTIRFTGLRVLNVAPAIATRANNQATVRLGFSGVDFSQSKQDK